MWLTEWLALVKPDVGPATYYHDAWRVGKYLAQLRAALAAAAAARIGPQIRL